MAVHRLQRELEDHWRTLLPWLAAGSLDGLWWWDLTVKPGSPGDEYMDERFWLVLGYDPETRAHCSTEWQDLIHPDDLESTLAAFAVHLADASRPYDLVVRYRRGPLRTDLGDSPWVWIRCRGYIIRREGAPWRMLGVHQDVSEAMITRALLEERLVQMDRRLGILEARDDCTECPSRYDCQRRRA